MRASPRFTCGFSAIVPPEPFLPARPQFHVVTLHEIPLQSPSSATDTRKDSSLYWEVLPAIPPIKNRVTV